MVAMIWTTHSPSESTVSTRASQRVTYITYLFESETYCLAIYSYSGAGMIMFRECATCFPTAEDGMIGRA